MQHSTKRLKKKKNLGMKKTRLPWAQGAMGNGEAVQCKLFSFHFTFLSFASEDRKASGTKNSPIPQSITLILWCKGLSFRKPVLKAVFIFTGREQNLHSYLFKTM